jgi:glutamate-1-semialdehyde 2,1-aminomutase
VQDTLVAQFNNLDSVDTLFEAYPKEIAAVIVEPVAGNMGVIPPSEGFLDGLRQLTLDNGALLIFDEVMTGFRVHLGGAQSLYNIQPDLTTLGKVIGGGLPVGAYGGRADIMQMIAPSGPVYQAGTLSGNPLAMVAGITTLEVLKRPGTWQSLETATSVLTQGIGEAAEAAGIPIWQNRVGTMFATFFTETPVTDWDSAKTSDTARFANFFQGILERGVYLAPSQFEAGFMSTAHDDTAIAATLAAAAEAMRQA